MRLRDGTEVSIRPIRPDDKERLHAAFKGLEAHSVYTRVFHSKKELSTDELKRLTELDPAKEAALVVIAGERIIAVGRYGVTGEGAAEVAFTVEEDFQRLGLAGKLLGELAKIARKRGIARFEAYVLPENTGMLGVFQRSGFAMAKKREDGVVKVTLELG